MKWRWIAAIVCTLYLGVGLFAATHDHSGHALAGDQCAACAWHHDGQVDEPACAPAMIASETPTVPPEMAAIFFFEVSVGIHGSRGPPAIPQV